MEHESTTQFNDRLAQWVARQGFWFQLRYSMAGGGTSVLAYHMLRMALRVVIFLLIIAAVAFFYLVKRPDQPSFKASLRDKIASGLACESATMRGFTHSQNKASIRHLLLTGGPDSFLHSSEASGVKFRMSLLDGLTPTWNAGQITVDRLSINVKAGAETPEEAATIGQSLTREFKKMTFTSLEVKNVRITWGYSERTMGSISGGSMFVIREGSGWRVRFSKGTFHQNWLRNMQIKDLVLLCSDEQIIVEKGEFDVGADLTSTTDQSPTGSASLLGVKISGGTRPQFSGNVRLKNVPLHLLLQESLTPYAEGSVSGDLKISGSTNAPSGVELEGRLLITDKDQITLRSRLPIFNTLAILSPSGNFRKNTFSEGYFHIKTGSGALQITDLFLSAPDQMELRGAMTVRPPTQDEIDEMLKKKSIDAEIASDIASKPINEAISAQATKATMGDEITLKKAASSEQEEKEIFADDSIEVAAPFQAESVAVENQLRRSERMALTAVYEGQISMTLAADKFPPSSIIHQRAKLTPNKESLILDVPLKGGLYDLTLQLAEELLLLEKPKADTTKNSPQ